MRAFSRLQQIQLVRNDRQDPRFGRPAEDRIIWRELLELELQDVDEQVEQMLAAAESAKRTESVYSGSRLISNDEFAAHIRDGKRDLR